MLMYKQWGVSPW